jgi:EAL domain-containing protein (putative c-di-GMP-specific phosphodiesterase class I)/AmiR/NasT family two-component response regulator
MDDSVFWALTLRQLPVLRGANRTTHPNPDFFRGHRADGKPTPNHRPHSIEPQGSRITCRNLNRCAGRSPGPAVKGRQEPHAGTPDGKREGTRGGKQPEHGGTRDELLHGPSMGARSLLQFLGRIAMSDPLDSGAHAPIRVLLADDDESIRRSIAKLLSRSVGLDLVGTAADAEEAVELGSRTHPDVALVDVRMPKGGGVRAARELHECTPETKVVALSGHADRDGVLEMLSTGAVGYLLKGANVDLVQGIMAASRGEGVLAHEVAADVIGELGGRLARQRQDEESERLRAARIEQVISERDFRILFQPVVDLRSGKVAGVEALARFLPEPYRTPDLWFADAWKLGLGLDLELAAVMMALESAQRLPDVFVALNVSPLAVRSGRIREVLLQHCDRSLVVELTEHAVVEDYDALTHALEPLRQRGVRVAVDDAGAGYASLRHVLHVKPNFIKLDISLISNISEDRSKESLAESITSFARENGIRLIAEGVETRDELRCVTALGVDYAQGYLLATPGPIEAIDELVEIGHTQGHSPTEVLRPAPSVHAPQRAQTSERLHG